MGSIRHTNFLEAVAAAIQHEKDFFDFCLRAYDELSDGPVRDFFYDLAEDSAEHVRLIEELYKELSGSPGLPNLKYLGEVYKFQATAIQKLMRRLDRNKQANIQKNEIEALRLAQQEAEDASHAFEKFSDKFDDIAIKTLFRQMATFNRERAHMLTGCLVFYQPIALQEKESYLFPEEE
ncbi:MAG: hypothetical protein NZM25_09960 [Leptospiraceae bacterium]|nr:hypothetical protein [Leptospiraceae bacterium]MDW8307473.1 hypothetical protein [Leptospiraceae bacterium]